MMIKPDYIFISGVSRTGSTLLVRILNKTPEISISNREMWFLGHHLPNEGIRHAIRKNISDLSDEKEVRKLVDFLFDGDYKRNQNGYWRWLKNEYRNREELYQKILAAPNRDEREIFAILIELQALDLHYAQGFTNPDPILGEKTPPHIYYVPTLMEWYPNCKVIHTFRDPRAIFASELRRRDKYAMSFPYKQLNKFGPLFMLFILLQITYSWLIAVKLHYQYQKHYPDRYYLLKFEDLLDDPENTLRKLCDYLRVDFHPDMLDQKVVSFGVKLGKPGFDKGAIKRWEKNPAWINRWFYLLGKKYLKDLDYE